MKLKKFKIVPEKTGNVYTIKAKDHSEARDWVINHLDLSLNYSVVEDTTK